nr:MAG TPA: hypothetical protein [Caudoviricetes sp.]
MAFQLGEKYVLQLLHFLQYYKSDNYNVNKTNTFFYILLQNALNAKIIYILSTFLHLFYSIFYKIVNLII